MLFMASLLTSIFLGSIDEVLLSSSSSLIDPNFDSFVIPPPPTLSTVNLPAPVIGLTSNPFSVVSDFFGANFDTVGGGCCCF